LFNLHFLLILTDPSQRETTTQAEMGPPNLLSNGHGSLFHWGVKRPECEADHFPPSSAEINNASRYTATPPYVFMACCLVQHKTRLHDVVLS